MPVASYEKLAQLIARLPNLQKLTMYVQDNKLNVERTMLLERVVMSVPHLDYFWLSNCVHSFDL